MRRLAVLGVMALLFAGGDPASAASRSDGVGFTIQVGLGIGTTFTPTLEKRGWNSPGPSALSLGIGAFVVDNLAVMARITGTSYAAAGKRVNGHTFWGAATQFWFARHGYLIGGVGLGTFGGEKFTIANKVALLPTGFENVTYGVALLAGIGYDVGKWKHHGLLLSVEVVPTFFRNHTITSLSLKIEYQYY